MSISFPGLQDMLAEFRALPQSMRDRVMKGAVAIGCSVIRKDAIARAPMWTGPEEAGHAPAGTLKRAIYQARLVDQCTPTTEVWVIGVRFGKRFQSVKRGKGVANLDAYYAGWVEYGHYTRAPESAGATRSARRKAVKEGQVTGAHFVLPQPFMRPAFDTQKQAAFDAMQSYLDTNIAAAVAGYRFLRAA